MIKLKDLLEISSNNSSYSADAGEPDTGWTDKGKSRLLGLKAKPEPWFGKGGYKQLSFPVADDPYKGYKKEKIQKMKVTKKIKNTKDKYVDYKIIADRWNDLVASWDKYGDKDHTIEIEND